MNAEGAKPRGHTSPEMKTRESGSQGIRPIGRIMMHHGKRVENYTLPKRPTLFALRRARNVAFWPRKGKASLVIEVHRACCKTAEIQRRRCDIYPVHLSIYPTCRYVWHFTFSSGWKADTRCSCPMRSPRARGERIARERNSALLAEQVDNVSTEIIISPRITREKIYPACVCACCVARSVISVIESTDVSINYHRTLCIVFLTRSSLESPRRDIIANNKLISFRAHSSSHV